MKWRSLFWLPWKRSNFLPKLKAMKQFWILFFVIGASFSLHAQNNWLAPYALTIETATPFSNFEATTDQMALSFDAQQWSMQVLQYTLQRLQQNPYMLSAFYVQLRLVAPDKSKEVIIPVPVNARYLRAFRTEESFQAEVVHFLSDTYSWILDQL